MILNEVLFGHGSHEAAWRSPAARPMAPLELSHWVACARQAEAAGFDGLFLGDILCLQDRPEHHPSEALDPFMVLSALIIEVACRSTWQAGRSGLLRLAQT